MNTAQLPTFRAETVYGRQAYVIENGKLRLSALRGGGHLAEIRLLSSDPKLSINPLYVPLYQTIEPYEFDPARHDALYGAGAARWLEAGYMGHLLCFPSYGPPSSPDEVRNGLGNHGEAVTVEWKQHKPAEIDASGVTLHYSAELPKTFYRVERAVSLRAGTTVVTVEQWIENLADFDRPFNLNEHATFGAPFVAMGKNMLDLSGTHGINERGRTAGTSRPDIEWPKAANPDGSSTDLRAFQAAHKETLYRTMLVDQSRETGWFTMYNSDYPLLVGYVFPAQDNPWISDWQENGSSQTPPTLGKMIARGLEFGTSPLDEGHRKSVERGSMLGAPTYRWINGRQRLKTTYSIFLAEIPAGFAGVGDVHLEPGQIVITERDTGRQIGVASGSQA